MSQTLWLSGKVSIHRLLRAWPCNSSSQSSHLLSFDPQALTSLTNIAPQFPDGNSVSIHRLLRAWPLEFTRLTATLSVSIHRLLRAWPIFAHPIFQPLSVSIHRLLRAWPPRWRIGRCFIGQFRSTGSYEPDPRKRKKCEDGNKFRSTGSYEPDPLSLVKILVFLCFDPQALTSLTNCSCTPWSFDVSFDPQALTSLTRQSAEPWIRRSQVSIHRLLRAWPMR